MAYNQQQQWNSQGNAALAAIQQSKATRQQQPLIPQSHYSAPPQQQQQQGYGQGQQPQSYSSPRQQQQPGGFMGSGYGSPQQQQQQQQQYHGMQSPQQQQHRPHQHHHQHQHQHQHQHHHHHHHHQHQHQQQHVQQARHHHHHHHQQQHHQHQHQQQGGQNWSGSRGQPQQHQFRQQHPPQQQYQTPVPTKTPQQKKLEEAQAILRSQEDHHKKCMDYANMLKEQKGAQEQVAKSLIEQNEKLDNLEKELTEREAKLSTYEATIENEERAKLETQKEKLEIIKKQLQLANSKADRITSNLPYRASVPCDVHKKKIGARELKLVYPNLQVPKALKYVERVCEGDSSVALTKFTVQKPESDDEKLIAAVPVPVTDGSEQPPITIRLLLLEKNSHLPPPHLAYNLWGNTKNGEFSLFNEGWMSGDGDITDPAVHNKIAWRALTKAGLTDADFNPDVKFTTLCKVVEDEQTTYYIIPSLASLGQALGWSQDPTTKVYSVEIKPSFETAESKEPVSVPGSMKIPNILTAAFSRNNFATSIAAVLINEQVQIKTAKQLRESLQSLPPVEVEKPASPQKEKRDRSEKDEEDANLPDDEKETQEEDEDKQDEKKTKTETESGEIRSETITYNCEVKTTVQDDVQNCAALRPFRNLDVPGRQPQHSRHKRGPQPSAKPSNVVCVNDLLNHLILSATPNETFGDHLDLVARVGLNTTTSTSKPYRPYFAKSDVSSEVVKSKPKSSSVELF